VCEENTFLKEVSTFGVVLGSGLVVGAGVVVVVDVVVVVVLLVVLEGTEVEEVSTSPSSVSSS
jgi:tetrahydrodipicolinate N-succinyltransferase